MVGYSHKNQVSGLLRVTVVALLMGRQGESVIPYETAKDLVKFLERIPPITDNPIEEFRSALDKVLDKIGIQQALNGNPETNQARVTGPVRVTQPPISAAIYYYNYALATMCESSLEKWECYHCLVLGSHIKLVTIYTNPYYHSKWFVTVDDKRKEIVLAFRPSYNVATIFVSLSAILEKFEESPNIYIHTGFLRCVSADYERILAVLRPLTFWHPDFKLIITGLSLGGEMSSVMTFLLKYRNALPNTAIELYTYGQSRCGNKAYADFMNNLSIPVARSVNGDDLVPRIAASALGYYHHHNELIILDDGNGNRSVRYCSTEFYEAPECAQSRGPGLLVIQAVTNIIEHATYFGIDPGKCLLHSPIEFFLQVIWPLRSLIPVNLLDQLPKFKIDSNLVLDYRYLVTGGLLNLYRVASQSSTYYDNNNQNKIDFKH